MTSDTPADRMISADPVKVGGDSVWTQPSPMQRCTATQVNLTPSHAIMGRTATRRRALTHIDIGKASIPLNQAFLPGIGDTLSFVTAMV
jgi:hypothetical protein